MTPEFSSKVHVLIKEVFHDKNNADELLATADKCGISKASVGVPLLWTGSECLNGDKPIIERFQQLLAAAK